MSIKRLIQTSKDRGLPNETSIWGLSSEEADEVFDVLASETAREVMEALYTEPQTASSLSKSLDLSLQNVNYHLQNLRESDLIHVAETEYSAQGNEMKVYAPRRNAVLLLSTDPVRSRVRSLLGRLVAAVALFGVITFLFQRIVVDRLLGYGSGHQSIRWAESGGGTSTGLIDLPFAVDPWMLFFIGGLVAIVLFYVMGWVVRRPMAENPRTR